VGEAVEDALLHAEARVLAGDLKNTQLLRRKLKSIRAQKCEQMIAFCKESSLTLQTQEFKIFEREDVIDRWITLISRINELDLIVPDKVLERWLNETDSVVFEGAQGVLLDAEAGFHPYTTWSDCTAANAFELIREAAPDSNVLQIGVMRSYAIRHGPGPLPTETNMLSSIVSEHNQYNQWQGTVRYGWFDAVLARYALDITKGVDSLVVTHMDAWSHLKTWNYCRGYKDNQDLYNNTAIDPIRYGDLLTSFRLPPSLSLEQRAQFTQALSTVTPTFEVCEADDETIIRKIESLLGQQVGMISRGPSSTNIQRFDSFPS
jgi:adenylosuccinate synthase